MGTCRKSAAIVACILFVHPLTHVSAVKKDFNSVGHGLRYMYKSECCLHHVILYDKNPSN